MAIINRQTISRLVKTNALRKGLLGGSPLWRAIWVAQFLRKGWSKVSKGGEAPVTFSEPLTEGQAWTLVHVPEESARGRGEGRRLLVGPKRRLPRATAIAGPALSAAGAKILEAPSAERINAILGENVVSDLPLSRRARRAAKRDAKRSAKANAKTAKAHAKTAERKVKADRKVAAAEATADAKTAKHTAKASAKTAAANAKADAKETKRKAKADSKVAAAQVKSEAKAAKRSAKADAKVAKSQTSRRSQRAAKTATEKSKRS